MRDTRRAACGHTDRDDGLTAVNDTYPCRNTCGGFFQEIPQDLLVVCTLALTKLLFVALPQRFRLLAHLLVDVLFALMVFVLATRLQVQLIHTPILQVVAKR